MKQQVLERQTHELDLGEKGKFKITVTDLEAAAEQEAFGKQLVPTKVNTNYKPNWSFGTIMRMTDRSLIICFNFILGSGCHERHSKKR